MFSLKLSEIRSDPEPTPGLGRGLLRRALGALSGLVLVVALDAYLLDHAIRRHIMRNDWSVIRILESVVASGYFQ